MKPKAQEKNEKITKPRTNHWEKMNRKQRRELTRKIQSQDLSLEVVHPDAAGIDIGNESLTRPWPICCPVQPRTSLRRVEKLSGQHETRASNITKVVRSSSVDAESNGISSLI